MDTLQVVVVDGNGGSFAAIVGDIIGIIVGGIACGIAGGIVGVLIKSPNEDESAGIYDTIDGVGDGYRIISKQLQRTS